MIINELYQCVERVEYIDFSVLPNSFVIKTTDGGNGDNVLIVRDKSTLDIDRTIALVNSWHGKQYFKVSREWAYWGARDSKVIVEKLIESASDKTARINDYKFLCFNGKFRCLWVDKDRGSNHKRGFWNEKLEFLSEVSSDCPTFLTAPKLPENVNEMVKIAETLAQGFPFVRVDLYNEAGKIYFGELTFYPWSGYIQFTPDSFDFELGKFCPKL